MFVEGGSFCCLEIGGVLAFVSFESAEYVVCLDVCVLRFTIFWFGVHFDLVFRVVLLIFSWHVWCLPSCWGS